METLSTVRDVLAENLDLDAASITADTVIADLGVDSLDMVELVCDLEERCEVELGVLSDVATIGALVERIDSLRA